VPPPASATGRGALATIAPMQAETYAPLVRQRMRELGYTVGRFPTGERNALVDVPGVLVGHATLADGDTRTGVTAILPHGGNLYAEKVLGACHAINAYGKPVGLSQLEEMGTIESPILITGTLSVGPVWEGGLRHMLERNPEAARDRDTINVIVGECFDGWLSDARALAVRPEHALEAIASARGDETREGALGAGTGTTCFGFKSGVGTSSRRVEDLLLGCLVVSNYGARRDLHMLTGSADSPDAPAEPPGQGGSIVIALGTDAPLSERQLRRLAARAALGLGRAGSFASNASGEYAIAFSTAHRVPHRIDGSHHDFRFLRDDSLAVRQLFEAAGELVHESVLGSLCCADATVGRDGHLADAFPYELLEGAPGVRAVAAGRR
jgi:D-aminopeptidase